MLHNAYFVVTRIDIERARKLCAGRGSLQSASARRASNVPTKAHMALTSGWSRPNRLVFMSN